LQCSGALSEDQLAVVAHEVEVILGDTRGLYLACCDDGWITAVGRCRSDAIAGRALCDLKVALTKAPKDRAAFFAPLAEVTGLSDARRSSKRRNGAAATPCARVRSVTCSAPL
jgi:hypothetical protein